MELREATIQDVPAMVRTVVLVAPEGLLGTEPPVDESARCEALSALIAGGGPGAAWVLYAGETMAGHLTLMPRPGGTLGLGMALRPEGRGQGGGRALVQRAVAHARADGVHKLELEVWPDNARAIALYASTGFVVEGLKRDHYRRRDGTLRSSLIMGLLLTDE
jgi:RimJ/RimL family protein N-acetyltransferase